MKRVICLFLILLIVLACCSFSFAQSLEEEYSWLIGKTVTFNDVIHLPDTYNNSYLYNRIYIYFTIADSSTSYKSFGIQRNDNDLLVYDNLFPIYDFDTNVFLRPEFKNFTITSINFDIPDDINTVGVWFLSTSHILDWLFDNTNAMSFNPSPPVSVFDLVLSDISDVFDFGLDTLRTAITSITVEPILLIPCIMVFAYVGIRLFRILLY